ncbi:hypothetical protein FIBSPDRAFT_745168 [Athelia psychrophila]|uniref:BTB domain-containing protein n=1 Tax=Athelia psychrophila TaxID=1759441 RepID=A0A166HAD3_9AGAM|nr:hypothetical protein FIBSPDRAFT_745168 [Fibularhizoctonia sp. CBS 109695]
MQCPDYRIFGSSSDLIVLTSDHVCFYLDSGMIWASTKNDFNGMLIGFSSGDKTKSGAAPIFTVPEASMVFTMIVCAIYGQPFAEYGPSFETLDQAINGMHSYGLPLEILLAPSTPLSEILLTHKNSHAIELYALAGHYSIDHLAVATSFFLLSYQLSSLSDETAVRIGPQYLKRLFFMHLGRSEALRRALFPPPYPHEPTPECSRADQMGLTRAWSLAASSLAWDSSADVSGEAIGVVLSALGDHLTCGQCQTALTDRIDILLERWASTKVRCASITVTS